MESRIGQRVCYSNYGVCEVSAVELRDDICNPGQQVNYYTLLPLNKRLGKVLLPESRMKLLRPALDREGALALIDRMPCIPIDPFTDKNHRAVEDHFQTLLRTGRVDDIVCVIKTMRHRIAQLEAQGKQASASCTRLLNDGRSRLESELGHALGMPESQVEGFIAGCLGEPTKDAK